jgi:hypothetical protein
MERRQYRFIVAARLATESNYKAQAAKAIFLRR